MGIEFIAGDKMEISIIVVIIWIIMAFISGGTIGFDYGRHLGFKAAWNIAKELGIIQSEEKAKAKVR